MASQLDAAAVHRLLKDGMRTKRYYSVTTANSPWAPWSPLALRSEMETRACHCSKSRVHKLMCGHLVAVAREAEPCALNCAQMDMAEIVRSHCGTSSARRMNAETGRPIKSPEEIADESFDVLKQYAKTYMTKEQAKTAVDVFKKMLFTHQRTAHPAAHLGEFMCVECGRGQDGQGFRTTVPVYHHRRGPVNVLIPQRDTEAVDVVEAIKAGVVQPSNDRPGLSKSKHRHQNGGHRVQHGRIAKFRREEKERVCSRLRQENLEEEIGDLILF